MSMGADWPRALLGWSTDRTHNLDSYGNTIYNDNNIHNDYNDYNIYNIYNHDDFFNKDFDRTNRHIARWQWR